MNLSNLIHEHSERTDVLSVSVLSEAKNKFLFGNICSSTACDSIAPVLTPERTRLMLDKIQLSENRIVRTEDGHP